MAEGGGVERRAMRTVLGAEDDDKSTSGTFDVVVKDHGVKSGLQYDSVCITPAEDTAEDDQPDKTVQVMYTQEAQTQGNLKFATVVVCETLREISSENTVSKIVHLRSSQSAASNSASHGTAASQPVGSSKLDSNNSGCSGHSTVPESSSAHSGEELEGVFASDPEALKYVRFGPKPGASTGASNSEEPEGIFASDPEALKYIQFGPKPGASAEEPDGIFASDPEALKCIQFAPKPGASTGASSNDGIFASDPEALKYIQFAPKPGASTEEAEGIFVSDPEALKYIRFAPKPAGHSGWRNDAPFASDLEAIAGRQAAGSASTVAPKLPASDGEGELLAEASGIELMDSRQYSVTVSGHSQPDGLHKKFVSVRSSDSGAGPTQQEIDSLQVTVETSVNKDGLVEKFIVIE